MKLGISSYSLTWAIGVPGYEAPINPLTTFDLLRKAHDYDIHLVQIADNLPLHRMNDDQLKRLARIANSHSIALEIGTRGTDPDHLLEYLRIAGLLGATLIRTLITEPDLEEPTQQLRRVIPRYQQAGVRIALENHGLHTTKQLTSLFSDLDDSTVGCCLDTVNSFSALDCPDRVIEDLVPYISNLHIKDFDVTRIDHQMGFMILGKPAGYGKLDIPSLLERIAKENKNPSAILELWTPFKDSIERTINLEQKWFEQSLHYLKTLTFIE